MERGRKIDLFDSTLRDGAQGQGIHFSMEDKLNIVKALDRLGIDYIEGGIPGANPKDTEFFQKMKEVPLQHAKLVAFGSTRRRDLPVEEDKGCRSLLEAGTPAVTIFGKCWDLHVTDILRTTLEENLRMVGETVAFFVDRGKEVIFDGEHFFDGWRANPDYAMEVLETAHQAGADWLVLCDTNGGTFPREIGRITALVQERFPKAKIGIHTHNDTGCAVAGAIAAVEEGASQVQGTYLGFGERCGNCNLSTIIGDLQLKLGYQCISPEQLRQLTRMASYVAEITNIALPGGLPYVGRSAFAHKGGMHVDGVYKNSVSFEHIDPSLVGNRRNILLSEASGRSAIAHRISEIDHTITRDSLETAAFIETLKEKEREGYEFESAGASLEILALKQLGRYQPAFQLEYFKILGEQPAVKVERSAMAIVKVRVGDRIEMTAAEGDGPVHALDVALRKALEVFYPQLHKMRLIDYKVRVMEGSAATASKVRVLIESSDGESVWATVGMSADIIDASWQALRDSIEYKVLKDQAAAHPPA